MSLGELARDLAGPGIVFLALAGWLVRKAWKAARTERDLEEERALPPPAPEPPRLSIAPQAGPLTGADVGHARAEHVRLVEKLAQPGAQIVWVRSLGEHVAWLERGPGGEDVLQVAHAGTGERWHFQ